MGVGGVASEIWRIGKKRLFHRDIALKTENQTLSPYPTCYNCFDEIFGLGVTLIVVSTLSFRHPGLDPGPIFLFTIQFKTQYSIEVIWRARVKGVDW